MEDIIEEFINSNFYSSLYSLKILISYISFEIFAFIDKLIVNTVPFPSTLSTLTVPPIYSIIRLQILNPRAVPEVLIFECSSSLPKSIKSFERFSCLMPTPESIISI